jgi:hypothetical protein
MRYAGIDIASEVHMVAIVGDDSAISVKPISFAEDATGYRKSFDLLGAPGDLLVAMATEELRELVRLRERLRQDFGDRVRQLHRLVDLGFPEFTRHVHGLDSQRQTLRAGLTPIGNAQLRAAPWMPTLSAGRHNPWLRAHYQGLLAHGKLPKVALMACMHKLLLAIHSVAKHRRPFVAKLPTQTAAT